MSEKVCTYMYLPRSNIPEAPATARDWAGELPGFIDLVIIRGEKKH